MAGRAFCSGNKARKKLMAHGKEGLRIKGLRIKREAYSS
jgi:hypothetical protein